MKLRPDETGLIWSTYLGGSVIDECQGIGLDELGYVYVTGKTSSPDFPGAPGNDLYFISKLSPDGSELEYTVRRYSSTSGGLDITPLAPGDFLTTGTVDYPALFYVARLTDQSLAAAPPDRMLSGPALRLTPSRPNPFRTALELRYALPSAGEVRLRVYDAAGRLVRSLVDGSRGAGAHSAFWDGRGADGQAVPGGVYLYRLEWNGQARSGRTLLVR
jgi:hypothetical protein